MPAPPPSRRVRRSQIAADRPQIATDAAPAERDHDRLAHEAACDGVQLLHEKLRVLLNSPRHEAALIKEYALALGAFHAIARSARRGDAGGEASQDLYLRAIQAQLRATNGLVS